MAGPLAFVIHAIVTDERYVPTSTLAPVSQGKTRVTIRLDNDLLDCFREEVDQAGGGKYQALTSLALRDSVSREREPLETTLRRIVREELKRAG